MKHIEIKYWEYRGFRSMHNLLENWMWAGLKFFLFCCFLFSILAEYYCKCLFTQWSCTFSSKFPASIVQNLAKYPQTRLKWHFNDREIVWKHRWCAQFNERASYFQRPDCPSHGQASKTPSFDNFFFDFPFFYSKHFSWSFPYFQVLLISSSLICF